MIAMDDMDRKQILEALIRTVEHISDKEYQKRIWIRGEGPEVDDFDETVCFFFGNGDPILENYKDFGITEIQYKPLKKLRDELRIIADEYYLPQEFIETPEWTNVMNLAKDVLEEFNYKKS
jgi:hypothetical protein